MRRDASDTGRGANAGAIVFDLSWLPFGRMHSLLSVCRGTDTGYSRDGHLYVSRFTKVYPIDINAAKPYYPQSFLLWPGIGDEPDTIECEASPDVLNIASCGVSAQICFDTDDTLRLRGNGDGFTFALPDGWKDAELTETLNDTVLLSGDRDGVFLFVPLKGALTSEGSTLRLIADKDGAFELAVHMGLFEPEKRPFYRDFNECAAESRESFEAWYALYSEVDPEYEDLKRISAYAVWICCCDMPYAPFGFVTQYCKTDSAYCWQSAYHALGAVRDADMAVTLLLTMFQYQDRHGQLPDLVDDRQVCYLSTKPPLQGFVFLNLLERLPGCFTTRHYERMYEPFRKWYMWWMNCRDADHDGIPQYNQGCECSMDTSAMFQKGVPVECPDLIAYLVLLAEALSIMADALGKPDDAARWLSERERLLNALIQDFWDGERFIARLSGDHSPVRTDEIEVYTPIILGKRLPAAILSKLVTDLLDPLQYRSAIGLRHAPPVSGSFMRGVVGGFWQIKLAIGIHDAGETRQAIRLLKDYCDINARLLPSLGYHEKDAGKERDAHDGKRLGLFSALACGIFLASAELIWEWSTELDLESSIRTTL